MLWVFYLLDIYWCFKSLGPWCNGNDLIDMSVSKVIVTALTTKVIIKVNVLSIKLFYLLGP